MNDAERSAVFSPGNRPLEKVQRVELWVFLVLIVPTMVLSYFSVGQENLTFSTVAGAVILQDLTLVILVFFFIWRNGESLRSIGWTFQKGWREIILGCGLFIPLMLIIGLIERLLQGLGLSVPETLPSYLLPSGNLQYVLAFIFLVVVAVSEEVIFRGYLILRFRALTHNTTTAVLLSSIIFSLGHGYQGTVAVIAVGIMGILFALVYLWRGSLLAPMTLHFLQNASSIIFVSLSGQIS